jgi:hypothetical protein
MQGLVDALDVDKSGDISRDEFDKGFSKIVAGLVRRGTINRMEDFKKMAEENVLRVAAQQDKSIKVASSKD